METVVDKFINPLVSKLCVRCGEISCPMKANAEEGKLVLPHCYKGSKFGLLRRGIGDIALEEGKMTDEEAGVLDDLLSQEIKTR